MGFRSELSGLDVRQLRPSARRVSLLAAIRDGGLKPSRMCGRMAMFRNILVHIPSERPVRPVIEVAVALTIARRSHLDAVAIGYESIGGVGMFVGSSGARASS